VMPTPGPGPGIDRLVIRGKHPEPRPALARPGVLASEPLWEFYARA
jgi:hypothetical protein